MMCRQHNRGFTLIEVLIGVGLLAGISLIIMTTLNQVTKGTIHVLNKDEIYQTARVGLNKMCDDFSQAFVANANLKGLDGTYQTGFKGDEEKVNFTTMSHMHYVKDAKDTDVVSVGYYLKSNERGLNDLIRRESLRLSKQIDEGGDEYVVVENVKDFKFSYYSYNPANNDDDWVKEWSFDDRKRLPKAVKIEFKVVEFKNDESDEGAKEYQFSTTVPIDLYKNEINF